MSLTHSGDGRADLLWINKYTGDTTVQINGGEIQSGASHFFWDTRAVVYAGHSRGANQIFGALGGQHRADLVNIIPRTNEASVAYNKCATGQGTGGDDPNMGDPGLPPYAGSNDGCVDDNGDGSCEYDIDPNIGISLDPETYLLPFQAPGEFGRGQEFLFDTPATSDITFTLIPIGDPVEWEESDCGSVSATGIDGNKLGCVAIDVAWLTYSLYLQGGPNQPRPRAGSNCLIILSRYTLIGSQQRTAHQIVCSKLVRVQGFGLRWEMAHTMASTTNCTL